MTPHWARLQETGNQPIDDPVHYGRRGSIRIDVLEKASNYTVCVYKHQEPGLPCEE